MGAAFEDKQRQLIPRWRRFRDARTSGETRSVVDAHCEVATDVLELIALKRRLWEETEDLVHGADYLATDIVAGMPDGAEEILEAILKHRGALPQGLLEVARRLHSRDETPQEDSHDVQLDMSATRLATHGLRGALAQYSRNPIGWVDLARAHILSGSESAARRAMTVAVDLAPSNRFVLRSAARMYIHLGEPDVAHDLLRRSARTQEDPWLLGAEIAVAMAAERESRLVAKGRKLIERGNVPHFSVSELAGAIGTMEAISGSERAARRLFKLALRDPTENTVAQATWVERRTHAVHVEETALTMTPHSHEARAWHCFYARDWSEALKEGRRWLGDQPFSSRPAVLCAYLAAVPLGRHREATEIAKAALIASPDDPMLLNNLTFSLASMGEVAEAGKVFARIGGGHTEERLRVVLTATEGLLAFRGGDAAHGRKLYQEAITRALAGRMPRQAALGASYLAREEIRVSSPAAEGAYTEAHRLAQEADCEEARLILRAIDANRRQVGDMRGGAGGGAE